MNNSFILFASILCCILFLFSSCSKIDDSSINNSGNIPVESSTAPVENSSSESSSSKQAYLTEEINGIKVKFIDYRNAYSMHTYADLASEEDVDNYIYSYQNNHISYQYDKKSSICLGTNVKVTFEGYINGELIDECSSPVPVMFQVGSGKFIDGFEVGLLGHSPGECVELDLNFPDDYLIQYAGKPVHFKIYIDSIISSAELPEINDSYVQNNINVETVATWRNQIKMYLTARKNINSVNNEATVYMNAIGSSAELVSGNIDKLVNDRTQKVMEIYKSEAAQQNIDFTKYVYDKVGLTVSDFEDSVRESNKKSVLADLVTQIIIKKENININEEEYIKFANNIAFSSGFDSLESLKQYYTDQNVDEILRAQYNKNSVMIKLFGYTELSKLTYNWPEPIDWD